MVAATLLLAGAVLMGAADGKTPEPYPLVGAVECRPRAGLPNFFARLKAGQEVRIAYLGGSITAQEGWRPKTLRWFQERYPKARVSEINAAIGGTGSDLGAFRLRHDVLEHRPDLIFVEFAVNDGGTPPEQIYRSMEGIVRQAWKADSTVELCFVYTLTEALAAPMLDGKFPRAASAMERIAEHYGIPSIHMAMEVARLAREGRLIWSGKLPATDAERAALHGKLLFAPDAVHPYPDTGHELYLEAVARSMEKIETIGRPGPHALVSPFVADNWENARMLPLDRARLSPGWHKLDMAHDRMAAAWAKRMPQIWKADQPGESITFKFRGTVAAVYGLLGPDCGQVTVTLDDKPPVVRPLFDRYCTYHRLALLPIGTNQPDGVHTVRLEIHPEQPDKDRIFREGHQDAEIPSRNPAKYDGRAFYAGSLMIVGEVVE